MAHSKLIKNKAEEMYVVQGMPLEDISKCLKVNNKTLWTWKQKGNWDKLIESKGSVAIAINMQAQFFKDLQVAIDKGKLTDPATADALYKTMAMIEKIMPKKMMLGNIFKMLQDITEFFKLKLDDEKFLDQWAKILPDLSDFLRVKYGDN